jgi:hypothetical protein
MAEFAKEEESAHIDSFSLQKCNLRNKHKARSCIMSFYGGVYYIGGAKTQFSSGAHSREKNIFFK